MIELNFFGKVFPKSYPNSSFQWEASAKNILVFSLILILKKNFAKKLSKVLNGGLFMKFTRRDFMKSASAVAVASAVGLQFTNTAKASGHMKAMTGEAFSMDLITLPYAREGLAPYISGETLDYHHGKHLAAYVNNVKNMVAKNQDLGGKSLAELIMLSYNDPKLQGLFNNAGQIYNHNEFFLAMANRKDGKPGPMALKKINESFGSFDKFKQDFVAAGGSLFGSGWAWLVMNDDHKLEIKKYTNANNPITDKLTGILVCDVWEHAYYIDYRNKRADFLKNFINNLVNWDYVEAKFA